MRKTFILFLPAALLILFGTVMLHRAERQNLQNERRMQAKTPVDIGEAFLNQQIKAVRGDLLYLANQCQSIDMDDPQALQELAPQWMAFADIKQIYNQVRFLDISGQEQIRINWTKDQQETVPKPALQNKSDRYYFQDTVKLKAGDIFTSPLDLNIEHGRIEIPVRPVIRFSTPAVDSNGATRGVVILNYCAEQLLTSFTQRTQNDQRHAWLLNQEGYWLKGPSPDSEWGFMLNQPDQTVARQYPDAWAQIEDKEAGQFITKSGLWTFKTVYPLLECSHHPENQRHSESEKYAINAAKYTWKVVSLVPRRYYVSSPREHIVLRIKVSLMLLLLAFGASYLLARSEMRERRLRIDLQDTVEELRDKNLQLDDARAAAENATRAKSAFLANMSHEIRTPMNAVIGMTDLLIETPLNTEQKEFAETIRVSGEALLTLINDILDFSKIEAGRMELEQQDFDFGRCVETTLDLMVPKAAEKNIEIVYDMAGNVPAIIQGDAGRLRQILLNLLSNAIKFTREGEIVVSVTALPRDNGYEIGISVRDTGIGIPSEKIDHIFETFTQADASTTRQYGGTGLGLSISRRLSELMGGRMWAESIPGKGSCFHFTLYTPLARQIKTIRPNQNSFNIDHCDVLIVDDNETNLKILSAQLTRWNLCPVAFNTPEKALESIQSGRTYSLMITDMQMPDMNGTELVREVRKLRPANELPIIMLTSTGLSRRDETLHISSCISKPVKPAQLHQDIERILQGYGSTPSSDRARTTAIPSSAESLKILVTEDNTLNQKVALRMLEKLNYQADLAHDGVEALEKVDQKEYDLILMDIQMPRMDGLTATQELHSRFKDKKRPLIIGMTAHASNEERERGLAAGMDDYLTKPIQLTKLKEMLTRTSAIIGNSKT
ncbi:hybrid sensor histidine kinase/response regulator [Tichowtungia aerotolerans]|uniref:histidine kinase n=1 Tax=Tichowtungia aerotolerans TaxID=2697043 RepID=A0A6P1MDD8_9BACT|nr:hybrid sensor histidine kinase/response regulator [Tichowtungia aerotolerans]QHI69606.1 response regulator [Tichowtungia aerotolerans]